MKKIITLLLTIFLCSCSSNFSLSEEYYNAGKLSEIEDFKAFNELESKNKSFAIFVYMNGCTTCAAFKPIVEEFAKKNGITILTISTSNIDGQDNSIMQTIEYTPSIILYKNGKPTTYLDATSNKHVKYYETIEGLTEWFEMYINLK